MGFTHWDVTNGLLAQAPSTFREGLATGQLQAWYKDRKVSEGLGMGQLQVWHKDSKVGD